VSEARRVIGILLHPRETGHEESLEQSLARAAAHGFATWICRDEPAAAMAEHASDTTVLVTIGGDGTFLLGARLAAPLGIPVLGVNRGQLGFLTDVELDALPAAIDEIAAGRHRLVRRSMLEVEVPGTDAAGAPLLVDRALNEVVVKSTGSNLARIRVEADDELLGEFDADGVIVATATGSTAYALSAGGPPVDPRVRAMVVVPLAPHAVITRAVVLPEAVSLFVTVVRGRAFAAADGSVPVALREGARVTVRPGADLQVVQLSGSPSFLRRLREKVRFGLPLKESLDEPDWHRATHEQGEP
jgi:NAD+ kinase